tara:strand:- start:60 stop:260 length:201 start_codon:yes stop_codon:yes gene_type:complete
LTEFKIDGNLIYTRRVVWRSEMTELKRPNPYYAKDTKVTEDTTQISRGQEQSSSKTIAVPPRPFPR